MIRSGRRSPKIFAAAGTVLLAMAAAAPALAAGGSSSAASDTAAGQAVQVEIHPETLASILGIQSLFNGVLQLAPVSVDLDTATAGGPLATTQSSSSSDTHGSAAACKALSGNTNAQAGCTIQNTVHNLTTGGAMSNSSAVSQPLNLTAPTFANATLNGAVQTVDTEINSITQQLGSADPALQSSLQNFENQLEGDLNSLTKGGTVSRVLQAAYPGVGSAEQSVYDVQDFGFGEFKIAPYYARTAADASQAESTTETVTLGQTSALTGLAGMAASLQSLMTNLQTQINKTPAGGTVNTLSATINGQVNNLLNTASGAGLPVDKAQKLYNSLNDLSKLVAYAQDTVDLSSVVAWDATSLSTVKPSTTDTSSASTKVSDIQILKFDSNLASTLGLPSASTAVLEIKGATASAMAATNAKDTSATSGLSEVDLMGSPILTADSLVDTLNGTIQQLPSGTPVTAKCPNGLAVGTTCEFDAGPLAIILTRGYPDVVKPDAATHTTASKASVTALEADIDYNPAGASGSAVKAASTGGNGYERLASVMLANASATQDYSTASNAAPVCVAPLPNCGVSFPLVGFAGALLLLFGVLLGAGPRVAAVVRVR